MASDPMLVWPVLGREYGLYSDVSMDFTWTLEWTILGRKGHGLLSGGLTVMGAICHVAKWLRAYCPRADCQEGSRPRHRYVLLVFT